MIRTTASTAVNLGIRIATFPLPETQKAVIYAANSGPGRLRAEPGAKISQQEQDIADLLVREGRDVVARAEPGRVHKERRSDFFVDGTRTELKTVSNLTGGDMSAGLAGRIQSGVGQGAHIIIDARRQHGMTEAIANRAIRRAYGAFADRGDTRVQNIRVIGPDFDLRVPFNP